MFSCWRMVRALEAFSLHDNDKGHGLTRESHERLRRASHIVKARAHDETPPEKCSWGSGHGRGVQG